MLVLLVAGCAIPDSSDRRGNFRIEYYKSDAFGHTSTRRALYYVKGSRETRVTNAAASFTISPRDSDRIIYDTCDLDEGCTHLYFDGHTGKNHLIGKRLKVSMSELKAVERWSWTGMFVAIGDQYELVIVDLQNGKSTRFAEMLRLSEPYYPDKWQHRQVRWGAWSPDGAHGAITVMSPHGPRLPVDEWDEELYSLNAPMGTLTLVATHTGVLGATGERRLWTERDFRWDGITLQPPR